MAEIKYKVCEVAEALAEQLEMLVGCPFDCYTDKFYKDNSDPNLPDWYFAICKADKFTCKRDEDTVCACWLEFCKRLEGKNEM